MVGFATSLIIPKIVISEIGVDQYGNFAILLGVCLIPSFLELGLTPGLTREMGSLWARGDSTLTRFLARRFQLGLGLLGLLLSFIIATVTSHSNLLGNQLGTIFFAIIAGCGANVLTLVTEIGLIPVRVSGNIIAANLAKVLYFVVYLLTVIAFAKVDVLSIENLLFSQFLGAIAYFSLGEVILRRAVPAGTFKKLGEIQIPWRRVALSAAPEQVNRLQSSILPGFERPLIGGFGGSSAVGAYDIAIRLSALVTAAPAAIAAPLIALLAPNAARGAHRENHHILKHIDLLTYCLVAVSLVGCLVLAWFFAVRFYNLENTEFIKFSTLIILGSGVNVLTASKGAFLYAYDRPKALLLKSIVDLLFAVVGLLAMVISHAPLTYIAIRYLGYFVTATSLLYYCHRISKKLTIGASV